MMLRWSVVEVAYIESLDGRKTMCTMLDGIACKLMCSTSDVIMIS